MNQPLLTADRLRSLVDYDPESGKFRRKVRTSNMNKPDGSVGTVSAKGYVVIRIDNRLHYAHRLAFLWMTGHFPESLIDHKDGDRANNAWSNLRESDDGENARNVVSARNGSTSSHLGVHWDGVNSKWRVQIRMDGKVHSVGRFESEQEAAAAYFAAKERIHGTDTYATRLKAEFK